MPGTIGRPGPPGLPGPGGLPGGSGVKVCYFTRSAAALYCNLLETKYLSEANKKNIRILAGTLVLKEYFHYGCAALRVASDSER